MIGLSNYDYVSFTNAERYLDIDKRYCDSAEEWQKTIDQGIANHQCVYLQLPRGHDKTERFAWWSLLWLMSTLSERGYACGVDRDNARLFRDAAKKLKALHRELLDEIEIEKNVVFSRRTGSWIETISSDADSAYGLNFGLLIINDFHAWPDKDFWDVLYTACGKRQGIRLWVESNALTFGNDNYQWIKSVRSDIKNHSYDGWNKCGDPNSKWFYYNPNQFLSTWQEHQLEEWKRNLHPSVYQRLIENQDTSNENSFVTPEQVQACVKASGIAEKIDNKSSGIVVTALDLGLKKDSTAISTVRSTPRTKGSPPMLQLLRQDVLTGTPESPVLIREVEKLLLFHQSQYKSYPLLTDPWNTASLIQGYPGVIQEWTFTAAHVRELTQILYSVIANQQISLYPDAGAALQHGERWDLQRELTQAVLKEMSYGQRIDHQADGYTDRIMSLGMCIHYLLCDQPMPTLHQPKIKTTTDEWNGGKLIDEWCKKTSTALLIGGK